MAAPIGKLLAVLGLDAREFDSGISGAQTKLGGFGSTSKAAFGLIGGAAAIGFGLATKYSLEAEAAQGDFMAATGRSRDEAIQFSKDMNGLVGTSGAVGKSFEEIYRTGITVADQFGITGDKATKLTGNILEFAKVTRSDANQAAGDLEDTLSAFGLTADDATGFMDKLIASHQKYGTEAGPEALSVLRGMSPALQAMGADVDDGIGLLNAFEVAGLDAATAQRGLQTAVKNLKPGETLDDLIAQIGSIEDPTKRAQKAIEIFGTRAGAGLAQVIKPGMTSLDDFKVSAQDAAGATEKAAGDMLTTGDKFKQFAEKAGAALRGLGIEFGPLVSGIGAIGSLAAPFAGKLTGLFTGLAKSGPIKAAAGLVGAATGAAQAAAHEAAATGVSAVKSLAAKIGAMAIPLAPAGTTVGVAVGTAIQAGALLGIAGLAALLIVGIAQAIQKPAHDLIDPLVDGILGDGTQIRGAGQIWAREYNLGIQQGLTQEQAKNRAMTFLNSEEARQSAIDQGLLIGTTLGDTTAKAFTSQLATHLATERAEFVEAGQTVGEGTVEGWVRMDPAGRMAEEFGTDWKQRYSQNLVDLVGKTGEDAGKEATDSLAAALDSSESTHTIFDSIDRLKTAIEEYLSPRKRALKLIGGDYIGTLIDGMQSEDPAIKTASQDLAIDAIATIEAAGLEGKKGQKGLKKIGVLYDQLLATGMEDEAIATALRAAGVSEDVIAALSSQKRQDQANTGGEHVGASWMKGLVGGITSKQWMLTTKLNNIDRWLNGHSPPPEGPLHTIDKGGENAGGAWMDAFVKPIERGRARLGAAVNALGSMLTPPSISPVLSPALASASSSVASPLSGGVAIHIHGNVYGGPAGIDELTRQINERLRQTTRGSGRDIGAR